MHRNSILESKFLNVRTHDYFGRTGHERTPFSYQCKPVVTTNKKAHDFSMAIDFLFSLKV
ncbi:MAG: hypothetical protein IPM34_06105 [Saprospiraceae bacterium]|nr:hypothetical protein [Saprospiraceae bacterium]